MGVDRCVCTGTAFAELLRQHRESGRDGASILAATGCASGCGLCLPYAIVALRTGRACVPVMNRAAMEEALRDAWASGARTSQPSP